MRTTLIIIAAIGIILLIVSCTKKTKEENKTIKVDPNELTPGVIQHKDLSEDQLAKIKSIHKTFEEVFPVSLEETKMNFKRDHNIDKEINLWLKMEKAFQSVINEKKYEKLEERKEVFKILLMRTMMPKSEVINTMEIKELSESDADYVLNEFETLMN